MTRGNHKIFYRINNRGNDSLLNAQTVQDVGDNDVYLKMGYTIVDAGVGRRHRARRISTKLVAYLPVAHRHDGTPITGTMRYEYSDRTIPLAGTPSPRTSKATPRSRRIRRRTRTPRMPRSSGALMSMPRLPRSHRTAGPSAPAPPGG